MTRVVSCGDVKVPLRTFVRAVKMAKSHPNSQFDRGLTCWWPVTGHEIMQQFMAGVHDRINQAIPYSQRGLKGGGK